MKRTDKESKLEKRNDSDVKVSRIKDLPPGEKYISFSAGLYHTIAVTNKGRILGWGDDDKGQVSEVKELPEGELYISVRAGYYYRMAVTNKGRIWGWDNKLDDKESEEGKQYRECTDWGELDPSKYCYSTSFKPDVEQSCVPPVLEMPRGSCILPWLLILLVAILFVIFQLFAIAIDTAKISRANAQRLINLAKLESITALVVTPWLAT